MRIKSFAISTQILFPDRAEITDSTISWSNVVLIMLQRIPILFRNTIVPRLHIRNLLFPGSRKFCLGLPYLTFIYGISGQEPGNLLSLVIFGLSHVSRVPKFRGEWSLVMLHNGVASNYTPERSGPYSHSGMEWFLVTLRSGVVVIHTPDWSGL